MQKESRETTEQMEQILAGNQFEIERRETTEQMEQILAGNQFEIESRETTDQMEQILAGNQFEIERRETTEQMEQILAGNQFEIERQKQLNRELSIDRDRKDEALNMLKRLQELEERAKNAVDKLMTAEARNAMLEEEIVTFEGIQAEMSMRIENERLQKENFSEQLLSLYYKYEEAVEDHALMSFMLQFWTEKVKQCRGMETSVKSKEIAEKCVATLTSDVPPIQRIRILIPIIQTTQLPINLAAINMQTKVVEQMSAEELLPVLPEAIPGLLTGYNDDEVSVRLASLKCLVAMYMNVGESLRQYLSDLNESQIIMLNLFINKPQAQQGSGTVLSPQSSDTSC